MFWLGLLLGILFGPWLWLVLFGFLCEYEDSINNWWGRFVKWWYHVDGIMDGKHYNTDTATYLAKYFGCKHYSLYLSPKGTVFEVYNRRINQVWDKERFIEKAKLWAENSAEWRDVLHIHFNVYVPAPTVEEG